MSDPYNSVGSSFKNIRKFPKAPPNPMDRWDWWRKVRKIARLGGVNPRIPVCPMQVLGASMEKARHGRIKSVFVSIEWDNGDFATDYSQAFSSQLLGHAYNVQTKVHEIIHDPKQDAP